jgi:phosphoribosyl-ATP pyrophosphohydrolase
MDQVKELVEAAGSARVTIAGGVTTPDELAELDKLGADAQVGMALYSGRLELADAIAAPLSSDRPDGLWPTVICDEYGIALGLAYSNAESLREAVRRRQGVYHSRSRGLWVKGESSGALQQLLAIDLDCDRDTLRFIVRQSAPGFCHLETHTCWGEDSGLSHLGRLLHTRKSSAPAGSYTKRLFEDDSLLSSKILEEAKELCEATSRADVVWEAADSIYFTLVKMSKEGISLSEVEDELRRRSLKISRRPGNAK